MYHNWFQDHLDTVVRSRPWSSTKTIKPRFLSLTHCYCVQTNSANCILQVSRQLRISFFLSISVTVTPNRDFFKFLLINYLVLQRVGHIFFFFLCLCIKGNMAIYSKTLLCYCCFIISFLFTPKQFWLDRQFEHSKTKLNVSEC